MKSIDRRIPEDNYAADVRNCCIRVMALFHMGIYAGLVRSQRPRKLIQTFYQGIKHKPETTFGNVKADVLADKDPKFQRMNFCSVIRGSQWEG
jgi:hypothetical protein